jgi:hypothetical protein
MNRQPTVAFYCFIFGYVLLAVGYYMYAGQEHTGPLGYIEAVQIDMFGSASTRLTALLFAGVVLIPFILISFALEKLAYVVAFAR